MKFNWFGVLLIVVGVSILAGMTFGQDWFNVLIRFWPVLFIIRGLNNWEREDQTKAFQVSQIGLGSLLIADNFVALPALEGVWHYWPALLVLAGVYFIVGGNGGFKERHIVIGATNGKANVKSGGTGMKYHMVKELVEGTKRATVNIGFNAGKIIIGGTTRELMEADVSTTLGEPDIRYAHGEMAELKIRQGDGGAKGMCWGEHENAWYLKFTDAIPLNFDIEANAGKAEIDLTEYVVEKLGIEGNAGKFSIRIGEKSPEVNLRADVNAGKVSIFIPTTAGMIATGSSALGTADFEGAGLVKDGASWKSPGFEDAAIKVRLNYSVNVGKIAVRRF